LGAKKGIDGDNEGETKGCGGGGGPGYGVGTGKDLQLMESAQPLGDNPMAVDAVLLSCGGKDGSYLVAAISRRQLDMNNTIFCLRLPEVGVLLHPKHPDTTMFTSTKDGWESDKSLVMTPVEPMKKWTVEYQGPMVHKNTQETFDVVLKGTYTSNLAHFDFDSDMNPWTAARAFAKEPWSKEYFDKIKKAHQSHYEQFGQLTGTVEVNGKVHDLELDVMRDHTHGSTRDWRLMHRYGVQNFTTKNGLRGFIGVVSQPSTFSTLELGYIYKPSGEAVAVQEVDLPLWQHGEGGDAPLDYGFRFKAGDEWFEVQVKVLDFAEVFMGWEWEARILERFCEYKVNGVGGWGVSEWHYNNKTVSRPDECVSADPVHTRNVKKYVDLF